MANIFVPNPEELGRRRFPDNKGFRRNLATRASDTLSLLTSLLPSNYPKDPSTNLALFNNVTARESSRLDISMGSINDDKQWSVSRIRYLQQILGERLFLSGRLAPANYNDESYREYLIAVKNAYLTGSRKSTIEDLASQFTGLDVHIKELYLAAREPNSSLDVSSTHKMVVDIFVDDMLRAGRNISTLIEEMTFFINLVRPAHVLYDTRFIWSEEIDVNKTTDLIFGDTGGGCIPQYDYIPFDEPTWLAKQVFILNNSAGSVGQIDSIHNADLLFYLDNSTRVITEPGISGTKIYKDGRQVTFNALEIGQYVFINYIAIPGDFQFWWIPPDISISSISRFYRDVYRRPAFQEFVKKVMDSKGRFPLQIKTTPTTICDRWVQDSLQPLYEDMRSQCIGGIHTEIYDSTLRERMGFPKLAWPYPQNEIYDEKLLGNDYIFEMPYSPLTDGASSPATINNVLVKFDGTSIFSSISSVDASSARVNITESEPYWDSTVGRLPKPGDEFTFNYYYLNDGTNYDATSSYVFGVSYWQMPHTPIINGSGTGDLASISDMTVAVNGTVITGAVSAIDPLMGHVILQSSSDFWNLSELGRLPVAEINKKDLFTLTATDITNKYVTLSSPPDESIVVLKVDGVKQDSSSFYVSGNTIKWDGRSLEAALVSGDNLEAIYDTIGDVFEFSHYWGEKYQYSMIFDDPGRIFDGNIEELYGIVLDGDLNCNPEISAVIPPSPLEIGYRWRAHLLHHSSVLNSPDTLTLNTYQKPGNRASIANQMDVLNHYNKVFSPEFLYDQNAVDIKHLDDRYLENGLDPVLKLNEGTPPFQKTFWSHGDLIYQHKIQDIRSNHHPLIYSDLLVREFYDNGESVPLNSICDSNRISFKIRMGQDDIPQITECSPWILFDSIETKNEDLSIPGEMVGVPNLRVPGIHLRENFILREIEPTGAAVYSYSLHTPSDRKEVFYQLPISFQYPQNPTSQDEVYDFPSIPIMKNATEMADPEDIEVKIDGVVIPNAVKSIDPVTGMVELFSIPTYIDDNYITLTSVDIINKWVLLPHYPYDPQNVSFNIINGPAQFMNEDFYIQGQKLSWDESLSVILEVGDKIRVSYSVDPLIGVDLELTYRILSTVSLTVIDPERSRIFDDKYVFDGGCPDIESTMVGWKFNEYVNFMDDYSSGIKMSFFNNDNHQIEEHIFSGPVFEYWDCSEDQIGSPENFPNALVRVQRSIRSINPLISVIDYGFMNDRAVRFRKKTFKELLPDRTFRTIKLTEMLPI